MGCDHEACDHCSWRLNHAHNDASTLRRLLTKAEAEATSVVLDPRYQEMLKERNASRDILKAVKILIDGCLYAEAADLLRGR